MEMQALTHLATLQTILLFGLFLAGIAMGIWIGLEMRAMRQMLLHVQTSAEHIAEMTRDILRRVS